jgi:hypothetical protein
MVYANVKTDEICLRYVMGADESESGCWESNVQLFTLGVFNWLDVRLSTSTFTIPGTHDVA